MDKTEIYCTERATKTCDCYPNYCRGCNALRYIYNGRILDAAQYDKIMNNKTKKEAPPMRYDDVKISVGGRLYPVQTINWIQTAGEFPKVEVEAYVDPRNYACASTRYNQPKCAPLPSIKNVIFNPPATIVFWSDKTKTVVKCDIKSESYDPEKGIAMAISRKLLGENKYEYYNVFKHWLKKWNNRPVDALNGKPANESL